MSKVLLLSLLAVFALIFCVSAEAPLTPDAMEQPVLEAGPVMTLTMENVAVTEELSQEAERPNWDYTPRDAGAETTCTTNEATAVEGSGGDGIWPGGDSRL